MVMKALKLHLKLEVNRDWLMFAGDLMEMFIQIPV